MVNNKYLERIRNFQISFFAIVLGFIGFTLLFQKVEGLLKLNSTISVSLLMITIILFVLILVLYFLKLVLYPSSVKAEFFHPIKMSFFPLIAKIFIVMSIVFLELNMVVSKYLWITGTVLQLCFTYVIVSYWMSHPKFEINHITPAWFIPVVGSILIPIAGIKHANPLILWFFFSIGLVFWLILFILFMNRAIFHHPIPEKLLPSLFILFAPPAIGFISYFKLTGEFDAIAKVLYFLSLFLFTLILFQFQKFINIKFYLSWWAYTFPLAAMGTATTLMFHITKLVLFKYLVFFILGLLFIIVLILSVKTLLSVFNKELCIPEEE